MPDCLALKEGKGHDHVCGKELGHFGGHICMGCGLNYGMTAQQQPNRRFNINRMYD